MTDPKLSQFKLLCFDVYGTLVDWETGIYSRIAPLIERAKISWSRKEALTAFSSVEKELQTQNPSALYPKILADAYRELAKRLDLPDNKELEEESAAFGESVSDWPIFPDTVQALERLSKHYHLVVLSNVDRQSFAATQKRLEQQFKFDLIVTAQDVGTYKPNPANFEHMLDKVEKTFGVAKYEVLITAQSLFHDHVPAVGLGIANCWIAREGAFMGIDVDVKYIFKFATLGAMADALESVA